MDIISRNFFRLVRSGVFAEKEQIEPMSAWKWRRAYQYAMMHGLCALMYDGLKNCEDQFFLQLPEDLKEQWQENRRKTEKRNKQEVAVLNQLYKRLSNLQLRPILYEGYRLAALYDHPEHRISDGINIFYPFQTQGHKANQWAQREGTCPNDVDKNLFVYQWNNIEVRHHLQLQQLTNKLLNHTLQSIVEKEFRENEPQFIQISTWAGTTDNTNYEVTSNTLTLLYLLVNIAKSMLNNGVSLKSLIDVGIVLRKAGNKVDFVKLQGWIDKIHLRQIAHLSGLMLIDYFHFTKDEIPFIIDKRFEEQSPSANRFKELNKINENLFTINSAIEEEWYFKQGKDIFVHASNSSAMIGQVQRSASNFKYFPQESITNFITSFLHSLSHIEE